MLHSFHFDKPTWENSITREYATNEQEIIAREGLIDTVNVGTLIRTTFISNFSPVWSVTLGVIVTKYKKVRKKV